MKKLRHYLNVWDGIWSIPISVFIFFIIGIVGQAFFGEVVGFYDPSIWQTVFLAIGILIAFNCAIWFVLYFNFRAGFRYFIGTKDEKGKVTNQSKEDAKLLTPWQRLKITLSLYLFFLAALVVILRVLIK